MAQRRFGPTLGAGVAVIELEAEKTIQPAPTGVNCYVGVAEKGDVGELNSCPTKSDFAKKCGGFTDFASTQLPDAAMDFWNMGQGAGELFVVRVTDGTEVKSKEQFFSRHSGQGFYAGRLSDPSYNQIKRKVLEITAKNGGAWGGRGKTISGSVTLPGDLTETTLDTGVTSKINEWAGATLRLEGVTSKTYTVVSNTVAGVVTVKSDSTMSSDLASGSTPSNADYQLALDSALVTYPTQLAGTRKAVSVLFKDGEESEADLFGLEVYCDEVKVAEYPNLSLDPGSKWYIEQVINEDASNFWIRVVVLYSGTLLPAHRPGNWAGTAKEWAAERMTLQIGHVRSMNADNDDVGWVGNWTLPSDAGYPDRVKKQRLNIVFTSPTAFTVTCEPDEGAVLDLPAGTVGTPYPALNRYGIGFTIFRGVDAWTAADEIIIDVLPLPVDEDGAGLLAGQYLYPDLGASTRTKVRIKSNTSNTITLSVAPSVPPDEDLPATGFIDTGALVFPLTLVSTSLKLVHSSFGWFDLTIPAGPHATAAALATAINTAWQTASGSTGHIASDGGTSHVHFEVDGTDPETGLDNFLIFTAANASLNVAAGAHLIGDSGADYRVQAPIELRAGYNGGIPTVANYLAHADVLASLIRRILGRNKGLVKLAVPGVIDTDIQKGFIQLAEALNYQFRVEVPSGMDDDAAVVGYVNDTIGRNDFAVVSYPSYGYVPNPQGEGIVLRTLTGAIHGREALMARNFEGYHKAAAGVDVTLPNVKKLPTGERQLNEEMLNPQGVNIIKKLKGNFILWGDRTISLDPAWRWKHQREYLSHVENIFREGFDYIVFAINDVITQLTLTTAFKTFFLPEWRKRALRGDKFEDAVSIKIDSENNTNLSRSQGDLNAEIKLRLADTVERFIIRIGKAGIFEDLSA